MTATLNLSRRLFYFLLIGGFAALVHILLVFNLVTFFAMKPLIANIWAFLTAFSISYLGHKHFTFSRLQDQKQLSLPHFFLVASSAGLMNEGLYYLALRFTHLNYLICLILVLGLMACYSFIASRYWACR